MVVASISQVSWAIAVLAGVAIGGCSAPQGAVPRKEVAVDDDTLIEFSDAVTQALAAQVAARFDHLTTRGVIEMGAITNRTYTETNDFRFVRQRIRSSMINSDIIGAYFIVVEDIDNMARLNRKLASSEGEDLLDDGALDPDDDGRVAYDPEHVYVFNGEMSEITRNDGATSYYLFEFTLTHLETRQVMFSEIVESRQGN